MGVMPLRRDVAWRAGEGFGRGGDLKNRSEVSYLEAITPPGKVMSRGKEERTYKPQGCGQWVGWSEV